MRRRSVTSLALLCVAVLSTSAGAQRVLTPRIRDRGPAGPKDLPPVPGSVAREMSYRRLNVSFESYPVMTHFRAEGFLAQGLTSTWNSFGVGTRADYRVLKYMSATVDMTSGFLGGPAQTQSAEVGTRFHSKRGDGRFYPFADLRFGYLHATDLFLSPVDGIYGGDPSSYLGTGRRYTHGLGGVAGAGMEVAVTNTLSITGGASAMKNQMTAHSFRTNQPANVRYSLISYRYTLGFRYNPIRFLPNGVDVR